MGDEKKNQQVDVTEVTNPFRFGKAAWWWTQVSVQEKDANPSTSSGQALGHPAGIFTTGAQRKKAGWATRLQLPKEGKYGPQDMWATSPAVKATLY